MPPKDRRSLPDIVARWIERAVALVGVVFLAILLVLVASSNSPAILGLFHKTSFSQEQAEILKNHVKQSEMVNEELASATIALASFAALIFWNLSGLGKAVRLLGPQHDDYVAQGLANVYGRISASIAERGGGRPKPELQILGLTFRTTTTHLSEWIAEGSLDGWKIVAYILDPAFLRSHPETFRSVWADEALGQVAYLRSVLDDETLNIRQRNINIEINTYANVPVIHGFRLGTGEIYFSILEWDEKAPHLVKDPYRFYDNVRPNEVSQTAQAYRDIFSNWIQKANASRVEVLVKFTPQPSPNPNTESAS